MLNQQSEEHNSPRLPIPLSSSWPEFVEVWCLGEELGIAQVEAVRALDALGRNWPEEVARRVADPGRGVYGAAVMVELGRIIADCEQLGGFDDVLRRLKNPVSQRSAYSELVLGSSLFRLGFVPVLGASLSSKLLDAQCNVDGQEIYLETIAPERTLTSHEMQMGTNQLRTRAKITFTN
jgi:hypothetical protein